MEKASEMEKRKREETKRVEREERPLNTSNGREVREFRARMMKENKMKGKTEDEAIEKKGNEGC